MWGLENFVISISLLLIATPTIRNTISSENDWLYNTSVQDILTSGIGLNASEKILEKIINTAKTCALDCFTQKKISIDLAADGFKFPRDHEITLDLGSHKVIFFGIRISESSPTKRKLYSTSIKCQSSRMAKIEVKLPIDWKLSANFTVRIYKSTNEYEEVYDAFYEEGSISLILKGNSISKQISIQENDEENIKWKIFHSKSVVSIDIAHEFQIPIHNNLQTIIDQVDSPLRRFLIEKLDVEFAKNGISVIDVCSKFINTDENLRKENLKFRENNQLNLYLMTRRNLNIDGERFLSTGPVIIDGLYSLNSTEFILSEKKPPNSNGSEGYYNFFTAPGYYDDPEAKIITIKIKTNELKGKADLSYNSEPFSLIFTLEFVEFQVNIENTFQYENKTENQEYYDESGKKHYYPLGSYTRSNRTNVGLLVKLKLGVMKTKLKLLNVSKNKDIITRHTRNHASSLYYDIMFDLAERFLNKLNASLFVNCT